MNNSCNIPFTDSAFVKATLHVLKLVTEMRASVNSSRTSLMAEMQGDEGAADCLIWRNASKEYKLQAIELDDQMRELIMLAKVARRTLKEVVKVCKRGSRQDMYCASLDSEMKNLMQSTQMDATKLAHDEEDAKIAAQKAAEIADAEAAEREAKHAKAAKKMRSWGGLRTVVNTFGGLRVDPVAGSMPRTSSVESRTSFTGGRSEESERSGEGGEGDVADGGGRGPGGKDVSGV